MTFIYISIHVRYVSKQTAFRSCDVEFPVWRPGFPFAIPTFAILPAFSAIRYEKSDVLGSPIFGRFSRSGVEIRIGRVTINWKASVLNYFDPKNRLSNLSFC